MDIQNANQKTAARLIGKSSRWLRDSEAPRKLDGSYDLVELVAWDKDRSIEAALDAEEPGSDSDSLEELRKWKAKKAELEFKRQSGEYKHIEEIKLAFSMIVGPIGNCMKTIQKQFGTEAVELIQEALDQADAMFNRCIDSD